MVLRLMVRSPIKGHTHSMTSAKEGEGHHYDGNGSGGNIHNVQQWTSVAFTGVSVGKIHHTSKKGDETRPKNMNTVFLIRIY